VRSGREVVVTTVSSVEARGLSALLQDLGTAAVSDALDRLGMPGSAHGIAPLGVGQRMAGPAVTIRYVPIGSSRGTVGEYLDDCEPGQVLVLDNAGRTDCTVWGDILTTIAHEKRVAGTAINGVCRDVDRALTLGYPIYSRGRFMRTGKDRVEVADLQVPVTLGDVQVRPGDLVVGDGDGIVVVPAQHAEKVAAIAREISEQEARIIEAAKSGVPLREARRMFGYHELQRRNDA
jgi:4-hydroxy-4-methyl-2-oxoglutarate aldolase